MTSQFYPNFGKHSLTTKRILHTVATLVVALIPLLTAPRHALAQQPPKTSNLAEKFKNLDPRLIPWDGCGGLIHVIADHCRIVAKPTDPENLLIVVVGRPPSILETNFDSESMRFTVESGAQMIIASDHSDANQLLERMQIKLVSLNNSVLAEHVNSNTTLSKRADFPIVPIRSRHPIFKDVSKIALNRPGFFRTRRPVRRLARFPNYMQYPGTTCIATRRYGAGRVVAISDQSLFINQMIVQPKDSEGSGQNKRLLENIVKWLDSKSTISEALIYVNGQLQAPPKSAPKPKLPKDLGLINLANVFLNKIQKSPTWNNLLNRFGKKIYRKLPRGIELIIIIGLFFGLALVRLFKTPTYSGTTSLPKSTSTSTLINEVDFAIKTQGDALQLMYAIEDYLRARFGCPDVKSLSEKLMQDPETKAPWQTLQTLSTRWTSPRSRVKSRDLAALKNSLQELIHSQP